MSRFDVFDVFEEQLAAADEQVAALARALERGQRSASIAMAACLRSTIDRLERAAVLIVMARAEAPGRGRAAVAAVAAIHGRARSLLSRARPARGGAIEVRRFAARSGWEPLARYRSDPGGIVDASGQLLVGLALQGADLARARLTGATLRDVIAHGANLDRAIAIEARLVRVDLAASSMRAANLRACLAEDCDFTRACLQGARWHGATALRCSFAGAALADLGADRAAFIGCDLRGADLAARGPGPRATMAGAQFIRCDLRWTSWDHRDLTGVQFVDCKLHGVHGGPRAEGAIIRAPDLSIAGDRSRVGCRQDVLALWAAPAAAVAPAAASGAGGSGGS